ncbi:hypothetical protein [Candidatus Oscillochloris fontis]|uniref:hypothetical protein n=1 Tax=Candidatus Oscillochloris fontis TaxID=2496868 RepID=UPI00101D5290|nr:hypothetical protein [Candidatus Oscillochloris fontis]
MNDHTESSSKFLEMSGLEFQREAFNQIRTIFPYAKEEALLGNISGFSADILVQSSNGRDIVFEVKKIGQGKRLTFSTYPSIAAQKDLLNRYYPENPPVLALVTNAKTDGSVLDTFSQSGIPVITLSTDVNKTKLYIREAFTKFAIDIPELDPIFTNPKFNNGTCFISIPQEQNFFMVYKAAIEPAIQEVGLSPVMPNSIPPDVNRVNAIINTITASDVVIADITFSNPNVLVEVGFAISSKKDVLLITEEVRSIPFDLRSWQVIQYTTTDKGLEKLKALLTESLVVILKRQKQS